jgi:hypothetical protein
MSLPTGDYLAPNPWLQMCLHRVKIMLRTAKSRPVCLCVKHPFWAQDQIFITVRQLRICWCGAPSLTRRWVCRLQLLLDLVSTVILGSESRGTHDHILLSQIRNSPQPGGAGPRIYIPQEQGGPVIPPGTGFPFHRLLFTFSTDSLYNLGTDPIENTASNISLLHVYPLLR